MKFWTLYRLLESKNDEQRSSIYIFLKNISCKTNNREKTGYVPNVIVLFLLKKKLYLLMHVKHCSFISIFFKMSS